MSRKKAVKPSKKRHINKSHASKRTVIKRQAAKPSVSTVQKMEKEFHDMPAQMMAHLKKANEKLVKTEKKQIAASTKLNDRTKKLEQRITTLSKSSPNAALKKRLNAQKKLLVAAMKAQAKINKQLALTTKEKTALQSELAKYTAIGKTLSQFAKDWSK